MCLSFEILEKKSSPEVYLPQCFRIQGEWGQTGTRTHTDTLRPINSTGKEAGGGKIQSFNFFNIFPQKAKTIF